MATVAVAAKSLAFAPQNLTSLVHLIAFGTALGTVNYTTFVAGITLFKNLPRQTFGKVQSKLFPIYFGIIAASFILMIGGMVAAGVPVSAKPMTTLTVGLVCTLANILYLEPATTVNMFKRYDLENAGLDKTDDYQKLRKSFGPLHGLSSLFNLGSLVCLVAHASFLASKLAF